MTRCEKGMVVPVLERVKGMGRDNDAGRLEKREKVTGLIQVHNRQASERDAWAVDELLAGRVPSVASWECHHTGM